MSLSSTTQDTSPPLSGIAWGLAAALIWGAWPVISRFGVAPGTELTPMDVTAIRFAVAGLVLLSVVLKMRDWPPLTATALISIGAGVPYVLAAIIGLSFAPAAHAGTIIPATMMTTTAIGGWIFLKDRPSRQRMLGLAGVLFGISLIGFTAFKNATAGDQAWRGDILFVLSGMLWATYTLSARRWGLDPLKATALVSVISMIAFLPVHIAIAGWDRMLLLPVDALLVQAIGQGIAAGILALLFYSKAVASLGASKGSLFAALVPGIATLLAIPVLGEQPTVIEFTSLAIVTVFMVVALKAR